MQHIILIGCDNQFLNGQTHHARNVPCADIAEITRRYRKRYLLLVITGGGQVAAEVVNYLRHHPRPVDRVDRSNFFAVL